MSILGRIRGWLKKAAPTAEEFGERILWTTSGLPLDATRRADANQCLVLGCNNPCDPGRSFCAERHPSPADEVERLRRELSTASRVATILALEWACQEIDRKPLVLGADWKTSTKMPLWTEIDRIRDELTREGYRAL